MRTLFCSFLADSASSLDVRLAALDVLGHIVSKGDQHTIGALLERLKEDRDRGVKIHVVTLLRRVCFLDDRPAIRALCDFVKNSDEHVLSRVNAMIALTEISWQDDTDTMDALMSCVAGSDHAFRDRAVRDLMDKACAPHGQGSLLSLARQMLSKAGQDGKVEQSAWKVLQLFPDLRVSDIDGLLYADWEFIDFYGREGRARFMKLKRATATVGVDVDAIARRPVDPPKPSNADGDSCPPVDPPKPLSMNADVVKCPVCNWDSDSKSPSEKQSRGRNKIAGKPNVPGKPPWTCTAGTGEQDTDSDSPCTSACLDPWKNYNPESIHMWSRNASKEDASWLPWKARSWKRKARSRKDTYWKTRSWKRDARWWA